MTVLLLDEQATRKYGEKLAGFLLSPCIVYLYGQLGAGKTTLVQSVISALGYHGRVKSPTYTLVESYEVGKNKVYHFDLYRLTQGEELEFMGIRDYFDDHAISFLEWPEKGFGYVPSGDIVIRLEIAGEGRQLTLEANSERGRTILTGMENG